MCYSRTLYTLDSQGWPLSGVHSMMMEKLAQSGEVVGVRPAPFNISTMYVQSCSVRSS
jgi:hypothetical protein